MELLVRVAEHVDVGALTSIQFVITGLLREIAQIKFTIEWKLHYFPNQGIDDRLRNESKIKDKDNHNFGNYRSREIELFLSFFRTLAVRAGLADLWSPTR